MSLHFPLQPRLIAIPQSLQVYIDIARAYRASAAYLHVLIALDMSGGRGKGNDSFVLPPGWEMVDYSLEIRNDVLVGINSSMRGFNLREDTPYGVLSR